MRIKIKYLIKSLLLTMLVLVCLEIVSTALLPMLGIKNYRIPFNILLILYLGLKIDTPYRSVIILCYQYIHSLFTLESWAVGTLAGMVVCWLMNYPKKLIDLSSNLAIVIVAQLFQACWFVITSGLFYLQNSDTAYLVERLFQFLPESIVISLLSPLCFFALDKIWEIGEREFMGDVF